MGSNGQRDKGQGRGRWREVPRGESSKGQDRAPSFWAKRTGRQSACLVPCYPACGPRASVCAHGQPPTVSQAETPRTQRGASSHSKVTLPQSPPTGFSCVLRKYRSVTLEIPMRRPCTTGRSGGSGQLPPVLGHVRMCSLSCLVRSGPLDTLSQ